MICKMFTINGKAPVINNVALTGSTIAEPNIIMEYSSMNLSNVPMYDGFSVRCPADPTISVDYSNMCYYSTVKYDNPSLSQLTKATFIPISDLETGSHYYRTRRPYPEAHNETMTLLFPRDNGFEHAGAYVIPTAAYHESPLYVYIWLPDVITAPDHIEEVGLDCTTLQASGETCVNFYKCDIGSALNEYSFNETYTEKIINFHAPSGSRYFTTGSIIENLNYIHLISASNIRQYNKGFPAVYSAYDSYLEGIESAFYMENCTAINTPEAKFPTVDSAKNCNLLNVGYKSANNCTAEYNSDAAFHNILNCSAYNSTVNFNDLFTNGRTYYFENSNITMTHSWPSNGSFSAVNSNVTGGPSPAIFDNIGTYVNTYYHSTADNKDWYMENFPTVPATPL